MGSPPAEKKMASRWSLIALLAFAAAAEEEAVNPYTGDADQTQECYSWAADGQCKSNPSYMLSSCKYSCWEWFEHRRKRYPDAPIDKRFDCNSWANSGECHKNSVRAIRRTLVEGPWLTSSHAPRRNS